VYWNAFASAMARYDELYRHGLPGHDELWELVSDVRQSGNALSEWCATRHFFQLWNREYVDALAQVLRAAGFRRILELGAGRGILSRELPARLEPGAEVLAVDDLVWCRDRPDWQALVPVWVHVMDYASALHELAPDLVILPLPPDTRQWAPLVRATSSVQSYVMLGPEAASAAAQPPPGWTAQRLPQVERYSVCCLDYGLGRASKCALFSRSGSHPMELL
jgi:hypothetical protein